MPHVDDVVEDSEPEREQRRRRRDDVIDDQSDTVLKLSCFAYKTTHPSSHTPGPGPPRSTASLMRKDPPDHLPVPQLAQLSKCISCGLEWTSRKTAKQKRTHIQHCAKKHALTKDTVRILVEKEVAASAPTQNINETTLMDSVVPAGPLKKPKRQQVLPTIMSLPETRDSILSKAREILGPTSSQAVPQPTQQFGQSALARRNTQHPRRSALLNVNRSMEEPPSTQPFGASSLRGGITIPGQSIDDHGASLFAQDSVMSSDRVSAFVKFCFYLETPSCGQLIPRPHHKRKRPALLPPPADNNPRTVRRRLLQG